MQQIIFVGRIVRDIEVKETSRGKSITRVPLAINERNQESTFVDVLVFGVSAENTAKYCSKGDLICVEAFVRNNNWEDNSGKKHYDYNFIAKKVTFLEKSKSNEIKSNTSHVEELLKEEVKEEKSPYEEFAEEISQEELPFNYD